MSPSTRSCPRGVSVPLLLALALAPPARSAASGGPVDGGGAYPSGGLSPLETTSVRLVREVLRLRIDDAGTGFQAHARYVLSNPGQPVKVRYGGFRPSRSAIPADPDHPYRQGDHPGRDAAG